MPNNIQNRLKVIGTKEQVSELLNSISSNEKGVLSEIDFAKIIPPPNDDAYKDIPNQETVKDSENWWYTWNCKNWGTKWNAYSLNDERNTEDTIYFQTAWNSPTELMEVLSKKFPLVKLEFTFADEDSGSNVGKGVLQNGIWIEENQPKSQSTEAWNIYFELHPDEKERYALIDGVWEYIYDED